MRSDGKRAVFALVMWVLTLIFTLVSTIEDGGDRTSLKALIRRR